MTKSGTYKHQGTLNIGESTNGYGSTFYFAVKSLESIVGTNPAPMLGWVIHVCKGFFDSIFHLLGNGKDLHIELAERIKSLLMHIYNKKENRSKRIFSFVRLYCRKEKCAKIKHYFNLNIEEYEIWMYLVEKDINIFNL